MVDPPPPGHANTWPGALGPTDNDGDSSQPNTWPMAGHRWNPEWDPLMDNTGNHLTMNPPVGQPKERNNYQFNE